jgi:hypothetical protein
MGDFLGLISLILLIVIPGCLACEIDSYHSVCVEHKIVKTVGGCTQYGCGVGFTDGTFGEAYNPVPGQEVCTKKERRKK